MIICPCGSTDSYESCCKLVHADATAATSAEQLMRARYTAFCYHMIDFIYETFHSSTRIKQRKSDILNWATTNKWMKLEIVASESTVVEFKAYYINSENQVEVHHEISKFKNVKNRWYYLYGKYSE